MNHPNRIATIGQLRSVLERIPGDTPLVVNATDLTYPDGLEEQVITSAGFGRVDWGEGYGLEPDTVFGLNCDVSMHDDMRHKPVRPPRGGGLREQAEKDLPAAEPEAGL